MQAASLGCRSRVSTRASDHERAHADRSVFLQTDTLRPGRAASPCPPRPTPLWHPVSVLRRILPLAAILLLAACTEDPGVVVDLRTNLVPGVDFQEARLHVEGDEPATMAELHTVRRPVNTSDGTDIRVGQVKPLPVGRYRVIVELWTSFETRVARNLVTVTVDQLTGVTILITADCAGVICPGSGDATDATYCLRATCVPESCREVPDGPRCPAPDCLADSECSAPMTTCARSFCDEGTCYAEPVDDRCAAGETCDIESGCMPDGVDAGTAACVAGGCDDRNPCTDDECLEGACQNTPNTASCDDGVFCNGADTCSGGSCADHAGSPCGTDVCDEGARACAACLVDTDCPDDSSGEWGVCEFADMCTETGTRSRDNTTWACVSEACQPTTTPEAEDCTRVTAGMTCDTREEGAWGACDYADTCDEGAMRSRDITTYACAAGACAPSVTPETEACARDTSGTTCDTRMEGPWGSCDWSGPCDENASRSRDVTVYMCGSGTCMPSTSPESEPCGRDTSGMSCGGTTYGGWGACRDFTSTCDLTGRRYRDETTNTCGSGRCNSNTATDGDSETCSRTTNGDDCDDGQYCNGEDTCSGGSCSHDGDPCTGGTSCNESDDACWDYGDDGAHCSAVAYYETGTSRPSAPSGYSQYSPPAGCAFSGCTSFCQVNYCMPCPGGNCLACPL